MAGLGQHLPLAVAQQYPHVHGLLQSGGQFPLTVVCMWVGRDGRSEEKSERKNRRGKKRRGKEMGRRGRRGRAEKGGGGEWEMGEEGMKEYKGEKKWGLERRVKRGGE